MDKFRLLKADEIEVKVKQVTAKGAVLLLYKTARTDMDLLDETVGAENWICEYDEIKGNLFCKVGIKSESNGWVYKQDCGIESREDGDGNEKKGEASDAFKRAGFKWGIGRELYTSPFVWVSADKMNLEQNNGKYKTNDRFTVKTIGYDDNRRINRLEIVNEKTGKVVYTMGAASTPKPEQPKEPVKCEKCGKAIVGYKGRGGKDVTPEQHIAATKKKFGKVLCLDCAKNQNEEKENN